MIDATKKSKFWKPRKAGFHLQRKRKSNRIIFGSYRKNWKMAAACMLLRSDLALFFLAQVSVRRRTQEDK